MKNLSALFLGLSTVSLLLCSTSAKAQTSGTTDFAAAVANLCVVAPGTPGTMVHDTTDIEKFNEGTPGTFTVVNTTPGGTMTISPPDTFTSAPGDYNGSPEFAYRYNFVGVNTIAEVVVSDESGSTETLALPGLNTGTIYSSATTTGGDFTNGAYVATYTVTCS